MTSRNSVEDVETGGGVNLNSNNGGQAGLQIEAEYDEDVELERIKENYRTTVIVPELPANYPEAQFAFQELQNELQEFLGEYVPKVSSLQAMISSNLANGISHDNRIATRLSRMARPSMLIQNSDPDGIEPKDLDSQTNHDHMPSRNSSLNRHRKVAPVNKHMQSLQAFLVAHMDNLAALQNALATGSEMHAKYSNFSHSGPPPASHEADKGVEYGLSQQCHSVVIISTATAIFIFGLLTLSQFILGPNKQRIAYDVAMMFAFLSLSFHFGIILLAGRGARRVAHHSMGPSNSKKSKEDFKIYINFYLTICEQMQLLATVLLIIATIILSFLIFSTSVGFAAVVVVLSAIWGVIVAVSAYYKVLITVENMVFLAKNIRRLGWRSVDYVRTNVKARQATVPF